MNDHLAISLQQAQEEILGLRRQLRWIQAEKEAEAANTKVIKRAWDQERDWWTRKCQQAELRSDKWQREAARWKDIASGLPAKDLRLQQTQATLERCQRDLEETRRREREGVSTIEKLERAREEDTRKLVRVRSLEFLLDLREKELESLRSSSTSDPKEAKESDKDLIGLSPQERGVSPEYWDVDEGPMAVSYTHLTLPTICSV